MDGIGMRAHHRCITGDPARDVTVDQRGTPTQESLPLRVGSSPMARKTRDRVTRSTTCANDGESAREGSPLSAFARCRHVDLARKLLSRSTTNAMNRGVGSETATTSADVSRNVWSASSSASRRGTRSAAGRAKRRAGYGHVARTAQIAYQMPLSAGRKRVIEQVRRQKPERFDHAGRGRLGHDKPATRQDPVARVKLGANRLCMLERPRLERRRSRRCLNWERRDRTDGQQGTRYENRV